MEKITIYSGDKAVKVITDPILVHYEQGQLTVQFGKAGALEKLTTTLPFLKEETSRVVKPKASVL